MKLNKKIFALLLVFIAVLSISAVSAADDVDDIIASDASVDADDSLGVANSVHEIPANATVSDIESIINNTNAGDTLSFAENAVYDFGNISEPILIEHTLILQGNNATIKGYQGFLFQADEESVAGSQVYNLNFEVYQPVLWNGRALDFEGGSDYIIANCTFKNGNSGIYVKQAKKNVTIDNNYFYADEGATNHSTIKKDFSKQETGAKAINIMGGNGVTVTNNAFEGDWLDAVSIASGAKNVKVLNNNATGVWYGVFYGGGITNVTMEGNIFDGSKAFALGFIKGAGNSEVHENIFITPEGETAIYIQEANIAHGAPSKIETIHIEDNLFAGENTIMVACENQISGMVCPAELTVRNNYYTQGVTVFYFNDNDTFNFISDNFISVSNHIYIQNNELFKDHADNITINKYVVDLALPEDATGYLLIDVNGIGYYVPVENGSASFIMPELAPGEYTVVATYTGDEKYSQSEEIANITIESPNDSIISEDLIKIEKSSDRFEANFTDVDGNVLANTEVTFVLSSGQTYNRKTDANGSASIPVGIPAGNYTVKITNPATGQSKTNKITVLPRIISSDLTKYYRNDSQFSVTVLDDEGNPVGAGEEVTFNINGQFYTRTTDANGTATMNINLPAGNYTITSTYKGCNAANNVEVLPIITAEDLTKKVSEAGQFKATLVDGQGKPYANQEVTFNINGVFYTRTTDANGVAGLNIKLPVGVYTITSSFNGFNTANTVTVTA